MKTKNNLKKQREYRENYLNDLAANGFKRTMVTVHVDDIDRLKNYVRRLNKARNR